MCEHVPDHVGCAEYRRALLNRLEVLVIVWPAQAARNLLQMEPTSLQTHRQWVCDSWQLLANFSRDIEGRRCCKP